MSIDWAHMLMLFVRASLIIVVLLTAFAYLTFLERRVLGWFQVRCGPNRVGPWGIFQPLADGIKTVLKQEMVPRRADKFLYMIAPMISLAAAFTMFSLIPVGVSTDGQPVGMSNVSVALLLFLGLSSLGAYGVILAGWSSQSKYSFLGALRLSAQVISYELGLGLALLVPILITGSLNINQVGNLYLDTNWTPWYLLVLIPAGLLFLVSALAETGRTPFDLPECEAEIVAGYHTEYSSMKYAMFPMGEYVAMCAMAGIAVHFFIGGYHLPGGLTNWWGLIIGNPEAVAYPPAFLGLPDDFSRALSVSAIGFSSVLTFAVKTLLVVFVFMWIRATVPRFRYDQLMKFGWKVLVPVGLILVLLTAILHVFTPAAVDSQVITEVAVNAGH